MPQKRRSYSKSFKAQVISECAQADTSIANVTLTHNLNANLVHKWIRVQMLTPGGKKTHRAYVWAYATSEFSDLAAVVYDFSPSRTGEHARNFLGNWKGKLVCDDFAGYKAGFELGVTEIDCMAHARRKFFDLHATNKSQIAEKRCTTSLPCMKLNETYANWNRVSGSEYGRKKQRRSSTHFMPGCSPSEIWCPKARPSAEHSITA